MLVTWFSSKTLRVPSIHVCLSTATARCPKPQGMGAGRSSWHVLPGAVSEQEEEGQKSPLWQGTCLVETLPTNLCSGGKEPLPTGQSDKGATACHRVPWFSTTAQVSSAFPSAPETTSSSSLAAYTWKRRSPSAPSLSSHSSAHCSSDLQILVLSRLRKRCLWWGCIQLSGKGGKPGQSVRSLVWQGASS